VSRTLTAAAQALADSQSAKPFYVLKIERTGYSPLYLSDAARVLNGSGITTYGCVTSWGQLSMPGTRVGSQQEGSTYPLADLSIAIDLADPTLRGIFLSNTLAPVGEECTLYLFWDDASVTWGADEVTLYVGTLGDLAGGVPLKFDDSSVTMRLNILDRFKILIDKEVGVRATESVFADIYPQHDGQVIPLVFGKARKVRGVLVKGPHTGRLMKAVDDDDTTLYIDGLDDFCDDGEDITVRIGWEYIRGTKSGNTLSSCTRGAGPAAGGAAISVTCTGHKTNASGQKDFRKLTISSPPGTDDQYIGLWLGAPIGTQYNTGEVTYQVLSPSNPFQPYTSPDNVPHDARQWRPITAYDQANGIISIGFPYIRESERSLTPDDMFVASGTQVLIGNGTTLKIASLPTPHTEGDAVYEVLDEYVYAFNSQPSKEITAVYFRGIKGEWKTSEDYADQNVIRMGGGMLGIGAYERPGTISYAGAHSAALGMSQLSGGAWEGLVGAVFPTEEADWQEVPPRFYSANLDDNTWVADLGVDITTVTFDTLPLHVPWFKPESIELYADVSGVTSGGSLLENPADMIEYVLTDMLDVKPANIDGTSFAATKSATDWLEERYCGALRRVVRGAQLLADMAFQCRSRIRFEAGKIYLDYITNAKGGPVSPAVSKPIISMGSFGLDWEDPGEVVNELEFTWRDRNGDPRRDVVTVDASVTAYGRLQPRHRSIPFWLHEQRASAKQVASFWVNRWAWPWRRARASVYLPGITYERGDWASIDFSDWNMDSQPAEIVGVLHKLGDQRRIDRIDLTFRLPVYAGCSGSCEVECETGCVTACENWCQTGCELACQTTCESSGCESLCQLACVTLAEAEGGDLCIACEIGCRVACVNGVTVQDWSTTCSGCESCQASCVSTCQTTCELACEAIYITNDCASSCIVGSCESTCEVACEPGCTVGCEASCEVPCEIVCEPGCVSTCESACQSACQACESCETGCVGACMATCETTCQAGSTTDTCGTVCVVDGCETGCEDGCQVGGCELTCEVDYQ